MKRSDLKKLIKPIVKECIHESLFEDGVLSKVISEVMRGVGTQQIVETRAPVAASVTTPPTNGKLAQKERQKLLETKRQMLDAIGNEAYNGVNIFEGTKPMRRGGSPGQNDAGRGPLSDMDPSDPGVDISSLIGSSGAWKQIVNS
tara:strand:- start:16 stop:450 length:435 start_codon:yes stop_codon:yes gene_type:complete